MKLFRVASALALACCLFVGSAFAQNPGPTGLSETTATDIRAAAILTGSDVLATTFTLPTANVVAVHYYIDFTKGSLTNAIFTPAGCEPGGNRAATGYYGDPETQLTVTDTGRYHIRVPINQTGGRLYHGILARGTGTATSSEAAISYKLEVD